MIFLETTIFTRRVTAILSDDEYRELQSVLVLRPDAGAVIPAGGGIRKIRWNASGRGKRGGSRVIYYWATAQDKILMLFIYAKTRATT
jgi:mRNA-degrading endonuclease RelE of RelBE toxin-antitoxin system